MTKRKEKKKKDMVLSHVRGRVKKPFMLYVRYLQQYIGIYACWSLVFFNDHCKFQVFTEFVGRPDPPY